MKSTTKILVSLGLAVSVLGAVTSMKAEASSQIGTVEIKASSLNLRASNSFNSKTVRVLHKGQKYKVYGKQNGMYNLGGKQWVSASAKYVAYSGLGSSSAKVNTAKPASIQSTTGKVKITISSLYIRKDASFSSKAVGVAKRGQVFPIYEKKNGLYRIGNGQWITTSTKYVTTNVSQSVTTNTSAPVKVSSASVDASDIISYGKRFMGMRYVWGSANPNYGGFDCSGFIYYVYKNNGYNISRTNVEGIWNMVQRTSSPEVGQLVFFKNTYRNGPSHIGIYLGDGKFLNASSSKGISIGDMNSSYWKAHFLGYGKFRN